MTTMWWRVSSLCMLLACGGEPADRPFPVFPPGGGPLPDAGIDAPPDPASAVTVTVTLDGVPQPGVVVYFQSSGLGPSTELRTDATGSAITVVEVPLYDVNSVTLVNPFGPIDATTDELLTYNGVKPGDHLQIARDRRPPPPMRFTLTAPADSSSAASYRLHTSCGVADLAVDPDGMRVGGPVALAGCGATVDMLVESLDPSGQSLGSLYQADVAVSDGGSVELTGAYQPSHAKTLVYDTLDVQGPQLEIHARLLTAKGVVYDSPTWTLPLSFMNASRTVMLPSIPGAVAAMETVYQTGNAGLEHTVDWGADAPKYELDLEPFGGFLEQYQTVPAFGLGISYTEYGGVVRADYMRARVAATRPGDRSWQWQFVSPPATYCCGSQPWPLIPSDVHPYNQQAGDVWTVPEATLVYAPGGYDAIRAQALSIASPVAQLTGPSGRLVFEGVRSQ